MALNSTGWHFCDCLSVLQQFLNTNFTVLGNCTCISPPWAIPGVSVRTQVSSCYLHLGGTPWSPSFLNRDFKAAPPTALCCGSPGKPVCTWALLSPRARNCGLPAAYKNHPTLSEQPFILQLKPLQRKHTNAPICMLTAYPR